MKFSSAIMYRVCVLKPIPIKAADVNNVTKSKLTYIARYKLRIGESDHASEEDNRYAIDLEIINSIRHPEYDDETAYFDVAILETEKVNFSRAIRPICLPDSPSDDANKYQNDQVELIGWGQYHLHSEISDKLKRVSLKIFPMR